MLRVKLQRPLFKDLVVVVIILSLTITYGCNTYYKKRKSMNDIISNKAPLDESVDLSGKWNIVSKYQNNTWTGTLELKRTNNCWNGLMDWTDKDGEWRVKQDITGTCTKGKLIMIGTDYKIIKGALKGRYFSDGFEGTWNEDNREFSGVVFDKQSHNGTFRMWK